MESPTSPKAALLERERRWSRPAGVGAILGAILVQGGLIVTGAALDADSTAERLLEAGTGDADGQLLAGSIATGTGFVLAGLTLTFLFLAAAARSDRVRRQLIGLSLAGAVLIGAGVVANHFTYLNASEDFAASESAREADEAPLAELLARAEAGEIEQVTLYADESTLDVEQEDGTAYDVAYPAEREAGIRQRLEANQVPIDDPGGDELSDAADDRAQDAINDASGAGPAALLVRGGALGMAIGFLYTALWSMRTGLLSRFWGTFGMASAVVLALFFLYLFTLVWFVGIGFLLVGLWPGGRPPAWEEGRAVPWLKPGQPAPGSPDEPLDGSGRELSEPPLPEPGADSPGLPEAPTGPGGETPGQRRRKRKRRG